MMNIQKHTKKVSSFDNRNKGVLRASDMKKIKYKVLYVLMVVFMLFYAAVVFIPSLWMILSGFKDVSEMYAKPPHFFPKQIRLSKFVEVWNQLKFYKYYINTAIMAGGAVVFDVVINGFAGYVLSKLKPRGVKFVYWLVIVLMLLPATMSTVPLYMTFRNFPIGNINLLDSYLPIWIMAAANMFNIVLFKTSFDSISVSLVEAAKIDGATNVGIFFKVILPLSIPVIATVSIFTFNGQFGNFFWPYLLISSNEKTVLGIWLYKVKSSNLTMDYQIMTILFAIIPQLLIFALFNRRIVGGINIGGVKG